MIDLSKYYILDSAYSAGALRVAVANLDDDPAAIVAARHVPDSHLRFVVQSGNRRTDLVTATHVEFRLISRRFVETLTSSAATGWTTYPVVIDSSDGHIDGYCGLAITASAGPLNNHRSVLRTVISKHTNRPYQAYFGFYFSEGLWAGEDLLMPEGTTLIVVSERVKHAIDAARLTNVQFTRVTEAERLVL